MRTLSRKSADYSDYPDLVVIYLGMRAEKLSGLGAIFTMGPQIQKSVNDKPDGLLLHEQLLWGLFPLHVGMRQYWRDFDCLEKWAHSLPHKKWWGDFMKRDDVGFWHEAYFARGGFESVFVGIDSLFGILKAGKPVDATGPMFSSRSRIESARRRDADSEPRV